MKFTVNHPSTQKPDSILTLTVFVVVACTIKFVMEGVTFHLFGHPVDLGHADASTYGAILAPVLGAHSVREYKGLKKDNADVKQN